MLVRRHHMVAVSIATPLLCNDADVDEDCDASDDDGDDDGQFSVQFMMRC